MYYRYISKCLLMPLMLIGCSRPINEGIDKMMNVIQESNENWVFIGETWEYLENGQKKFYYGLLLPDGTIKRIVARDSIQDPDGNNVYMPRVVGYNKSDNILILLDDEHEPSDMFIVNPDTGEAKWVLKGKGIESYSCITWSPDGNSFAFNAKKEETQSTFIAQYNIATDTLKYLAKLADRACWNTYEPGRGLVYSEDGQWIYYVSHDNHVLRVNIKTKKREKLPLPQAIAVVTIKNNELTYVKQYNPLYEMAYFKVAKVNLTPPTNYHVLETFFVKKAYHLWGIIVSPSRRYVLLSARAGYVLIWRLIDVVNNRVYRGSGWFKRSFGGMDTAYVR